MFNLAVIQARANIGFGWIFELTLVLEAAEDCCGRAEAWRPVCRTAGKAVSSRNLKKIQLPNLRFAPLWSVVFASERDGFNIGLEWLDSRGDETRMQSRGSFIFPGTFWVRSAAASVLSKDQELPATEKLHEEEATALTKEEARCLQLGPRIDVLRCVVALKVCSFCFLSLIAGSFFVLLLLSFHVYNTRPVSLHWAVNVIYKDMYIYIYLYKYYIYICIHTYYRSFMFSGCAPRLSSSEKHEASVAARWKRALVSFRDTEWTRPELGFWSVQTLHIDINISTIPRYTKYVLLWMMNGCY